MMRWLLFLGIVMAGIGCGGRTDLRETVDATAPDAILPGVEVCNGLDDDLEGRVDEDWRDELGRYLDDDHCGGCDMPCGPMPGAISVGCQLIADAPTCAAFACEEGLAPSLSGACVPLFDHLCLPCLDDAGCGGASALSSATGAWARDALRAVLSPGLWVLTPHKWGVRPLFQLE